MPEINTYHLADLLPIVLSQGMSEKVEEEGEVNEKARSPCPVLQTALLCASLLMFLRQGETEMEDKYTAFTLQTNTTIIHFPAHFNLSLEHHGVWGPLIIT